MSQIKTLNGVQYTLPQYNDTGWGANTGNVLTQYIAAIADVTLQLTGGAFTLTADVNFGASFGVVSSYFTSRTANAASAGAVRLAKTDVVSWRNNANGANIDLSKNTSDELLWNSSRIILAGGGLIVNADISASAAIAYSKLALTNSIVNADIGAAAAIAYSKLALTNSIVNADVAAAAAIAYSKLAALTVSRAVQTNSATGFLEVSAVTNTELGYLSGVTSAIQTQINAIPSAAGAFTNILDNGGFEIWQRGSSFSNPANNTFITDRFRVSTDEASTVTVTQDSTTVDSGTYSVKVVTTSTGASKIWMFLTLIENYQAYAGKTVTLSVRVNANVASAARVAVNDGVSTTYSSYHTGGGAWETLTVTKTMSASTSVFAVQIGMPVAGDKKNGTFYFDSAMLVLGSAAITFVPMNPQVDLSRCQRFYVRMGGNIANECLGAGFAYNGTTSEHMVVFPVHMRVAPTITTANVANMYVFKPGGTSAVSAISLQNISTRNFTAEATSAAVTAGNGVILVNGNTNAYFECTADL